ncbi:MAG: hypothetical protein ACE5HN_01715 [Nitrospiria bacterium]
MDRFEWNKTTRSNLEEEKIGRTGFGIVAWEHLLKQPPRWIVIPMLKTKEAPFQKGASFATIQVP